MSTPTLQFVLELYNKFRYAVEDDFGIEGVYEQGYSPFLTDNPTFLQLANGTGAFQANKFFFDRRSINVGSNDDLDLAGSLVDFYGNTLTFTAIKVLLIVNLAETAGENLQTDSSVAASIVTPYNGSATSKKVIQASGLDLTWAPRTGFSVTATTADKLRITNIGTGTISYDIMIVGTG